jgi:hypothetical protein
LWSFFSSLPFLLIIMCQQNKKRMLCNWFDRRIVASPWLKGKNFYSSKRSLLFVSKEMTWQSSLIYIVSRWAPRQNSSFRQKKFVKRRDWRLGWDDAEWLHSTTCDNHDVLSSFFPSIAFPRDEKFEIALRVSCYTTFPLKRSLAASHKDHNKGPALQK